ncbi:MAG: helix-turn-helix domain-containing protein [Oscillospiraceae bacterium]|nr:helix-turn-helix domain-containing protein [Oscillospiraceae bacterium]
MKLKELRNAAGLSLNALSSLSGVSRRTIEDIEARGDCRISTAYTLCKALGCSLNDFYEEDAEEESSK